MIRDGVVWMGAIDWNRRLFDSLIPLPDGTSYNAYLIKGSEKTALLDTVDPAMKHVLMSHLSSVDRVDYVVSHHAEQDHSGSLPAVLERYPKAKVVCTPKAKVFNIAHLGWDESRIMTVEDEETLSLRTSRKSTCCSRAISSAPTSLPHPCASAMNRRYMKRRNGTTRKS